MSECPNCGIPMNRDTVKEGVCTTCGYEHVSRRQFITKQSEPEITLTRTEFNQLKAMVEELFEQRSEVYFTEKNEILEAGEHVLNVLQNRIDVQDPNKIVL